MTREVSSPELDSMDLRLIGELEIDARQTYLGLAAKIERSDMTVRRRLRRLVSQGVISFATVPNLVALGYQLTILAIKADVGRVDHVTEELVRHPVVQQIFVTSGSYQLMGITVIRSHTELYDFLISELATITGIIKIDAMPLLKVRKNNWFLLRHHEDRFWDNERPIDLDRQDWELLSLLESNPRVTTTDLAQQLGIARATAASRLQRLLSEDAVRVVTMASPKTLGYTLYMTTLIEIEPSRIESVAEILVNDRRIRAVAVLGGQYDVMTAGMFENVEEMREFFGNRLGQIRGILSHETLMVLRTAKGSWSISQLERPSAAEKDGERGGDTG